MIAIGKEYWSAWSRFGLCMTAFFCRDPVNKCAFGAGVRLFVPVAILLQTGKRMRLYRGGLSHCWRSFVLRPQINLCPILQNSGADGADVFNHCSKWQECFCCNHSVARRSIVRSPRNVRIRAGRRLSLGGKLLFLCQKIKTPGRARKTEVLPGDDVCNHCNRLKDLSF